MEPRKEFLNILLAKMWEDVCLEFWSYKNAESHTNIKRD